MSVNSLSCMRRLGLSERTSYDLPNLSLNREVLLDNRLLVESFILMEPKWALRTGSVPFWMRFHKEPSLNSIEQYLESINPYDEIYLMLFSHGVDSVGLPTIDRWRTVLNQARQRGEFIGVEEDKYPRDFATLIRYYTELQRKISVRYPLPKSLTLEQLDTFIKKAGHFPVRWTDTGYHPLK